MKDIRLYGLSSCSHCKSLRQFLIESGVDFDWTYVDMLIGEERNNTLRELRRVNPEVSFPTLVVKEIVIVGFKKDKVIQVLEEYQKTDG